MKPPLMVRLGIETRALLDFCSVGLRGLRSIAASGLNNLKSYSGGSAMPMKRCEGGHYYDAAKHTVCPLCSGAGIEKLQSVPVSKGNSAPLGGMESRTIGIMLKAKGLDPVVGWLVCIDGPDRGRDFRVRAEKNFIGRSLEMDIAITGDGSISREKHAAIVFDPKKSSFKILPGDARGLVYLNGNDISQPEDLKRGDRIELGNSVLMFVPLCGDLYNWDQETNDGIGSVTRT